MFSGGTDKQYRALIDLRVHIIIISNNRIFTVVMLKSERKKKLKTSKRLLLSSNTLLVRQISHFLLTKNLPRHIFV